MKSFLPYFLFLIPFAAHSQNWEIFNSYDRYNYQASGAPLISNVLFADSFKVVGTDTIYYLNRIVQKPNYITSYDTVLKNLPQFFQKQIRRSGDGTYVFSIDSGYDGFNPDTFVIEAFANVNDNWLYDTTANITATVASQTLQILFGTTDSVKQINLSNGDSILLSKSFGIVGFPSDTLTATGKTPIYYNLAGIETRGVGDSVINFWSIYNFNVGDVFMYQEEPEDDSWDPQDEQKLTILSKNIFSNSIAYTARQVYSSIYSYYGGYPPPAPVFIIDTISLVFQDSAKHFANSYPSQFMDSAFNEKIGEIYGASYKIFSSYTMEDQFKCKTANSLFDSLKENTLLFVDINGYEPSVYTCSICNGLGDTHGNNLYFESGYKYDLIGFIKDSVQSGTVLSDNDITLGISNPIAAFPNISLFPNLTAEYTCLYLSNTPTSGTLHLAVYDLTGRLILSQPRPPIAPKLIAPTYPPPFTSGGFWMKVRM